MAEPFRTAAPPSTENAVRSIRVATTLIERFKTILSSHTMTTDQLELLIGESQQMYPEIWRHMDDARKELVKLGRDVTAFDHVRREELGHLGVTDVDVSTMIDPFALMLGGYRQVTIKSAEFNRAGCQRAAYAVGTLMRVMPEVDWDALAKAESREIAAAGSLQSSKYLTILKVVIAVVALIAIAIVVRKLAMTSPEAEYHREREEQQRLDQQAIDVRREALVARAVRIDELWAQFAKTCETAKRKELARLLREDNRPKDADIVERRSCVPAKPECPGSLDNIAHRILVDLPRDHDVVPHCEPILYSPGALMPGLLITIPGKPLLRGVVSADGKLDIVELGESPGTTLVGVGDLDDDNADELVIVEGHKLWVSKVVGSAAGGGRFVDIPGPTLKAGCDGDVSVERDFRPGKQGAHKRIKIAVPTLQRRDGCLPEGRHYFRLAVDRVVED